MNPLQITGRTPDGKPVLSGAFQLADTHGVPLWFSLLQAQERGAVISIADYFKSAVDAGRQAGKVLTEIRHAFTDAGMVADFSEIDAKCIAYYLNETNPSRV